MVKSAPGYAINRARVSVALSQFTVPLLSRIYASFDGDMVAALVMGELAHRNVEAWLAQHQNPEDPLYDANPERRERILRPSNALSIAEACKLPRETVRRKIVLLIERGLVYRSAKGHLYLAHDVGEHFEDMTAQIVEHLLLTAAKLEGLLKEQRECKNPTGSSSADVVRGSTAV
jgi:hypothetical protein